jgi:hypothetical protein
MQRPRSERGYYEIGLAGRKKSSVKAERNLKIIEEFRSGETTLTALAEKYALTQQRISQIVSSERRGANDVEIEAISALLALDDAARERVLAYVRARIEARWRERT